MRVARVQFAAESLMQLMLLPSAVTVLVRDRVDWVEDEERLRVETFLLLYVYTKPAGLNWSCS